MLHLSHTVVVSRSRIPEVLLCQFVEVVSTYRSWHTVFSFIINDIFKQTDEFKDLCWTA